MRSDHIFSWILRLWKKSRLLCLGLVFFFGCTLLANLIQLPTTPFFVWNMYNNPVRDSADYDVYLIRYNNRETLNFDKTWKEPQKIYLTSTLFYYMQYKQGGDVETSATYMEEKWLPKHRSFKWLMPYLNNSKKQFDAFPAWYKKYLASIVHETIDNVDLIKKHLRFETDMSLKEISSDTNHLIP